MGGAMSRYPSKPRVQYGFCALQGRRASMEDMVLVDWQNGVDESVFALFDGHNGAECATYLKEHYSDVLKSLDGYNSQDPVEIEQVMRKAALECDSAYIEAGKVNQWQAGSTGIIVFYRNNNVWISNTGDSRAIAVIDGKVLRLSTDHKPTDPAERQRIEANGGTVMDGRVQGQLAMSRAFGDPQLKAQRYITAEPDVKFMPLHDKLHYIVLATDGLWDVMSSGRVAKYLASFHRYYTLDELAEALAVEAFRRGSPDNISVIIIKVNTKEPSPQGEGAGAARSRDDIKIPTPSPRRSGAPISETLMLDIDII